jgi:hypothetical protein
MQRKLLGIISVDFEATGQLRILHWSNIKKVWEYNEAMHQLRVFMDLKKVNDSEGGLV